MFGKNLFGKNKNVTDNTTNKLELKDIVCGMTVTDKSEHHINLQSHDYYFCSSSCHDKFKTDPEQYVSPPDSSKNVQLKDPVCGMNITADSNFHLHHDNQEYYFCSQGCEDKFQSAPDEYVNLDDAAGHSVKK